MLYKHTVVEMAQRKFFNTIDYKQQLIFVEVEKEEFRGYKQDLLRSNLSSLEREFLVCTNCYGLMRNACHFGEEQTPACEMCVSEGEFPQIMTKSRKEIAKMRAKCPLERRECQWNGTISEVNAHLDVCPEFVMRCTNRCDVIMKRYELVNHSKNECQNREVNCKYCHAVIQCIRKEIHYKTCLEFPIDCPINCTKNLTRKEVEFHIKNECPNAIVEGFKACGETIKRSEQSFYSKNECQHRKMDCKYCKTALKYKESISQDRTCPEFPLVRKACTQDLTRKDANSQIENKCPNMVIERPYKEMGCDVQVGRYNIEEHEEKFESVHARMTMLHLSCKVEGMEKENKRLNTKVKMPEEKQLRMDCEIEESFYPIILKSKIFCQQLCRGSFGIVSSYDFTWRLMSFRFYFIIHFNQEIVANVQIEFGKEKYNLIVWPFVCKFKLTIIDNQNMHNSLIFESSIHKLKSEVAPSFNSMGEMHYKDKFTLATLPKTKMLEKAKHNLISFTLQMQEVNYSKWVWCMVDSTNTESAKLAFDSQELCFSKKYFRRVRSTF